VFGRNDTGPAQDGGSLQHVALLAHVSANTSLLLFLKYMPICFAIVIKGIVLAPVPVGFESGRRDVPIRTAAPQYDTQVLPELFERRRAKEPVAVVDLNTTKPGSRTMTCRIMGSCSGAVYSAMSRSS
jgi:hypothetical protein